MTWNMEVTKNSPKMCCSSIILLYSGEESVFLVSAATAAKIKHKFSKKRAEIYLAACPYAASLQNRFNPLPHGLRPGRNMFNYYGKTRLYSSIRSKTTALTRCAHHHSVQRGHPSPPRRGDESAGKSNHRNSSSSPE